MLGLGEEGDEPGHGLVRHTEPEHRQGLVHPWAPGAARVGCLTGLVGAAGACGAMRGGACGQACTLHAPALYSGTPALLYCILRYSFPVLHLSRTSCTSRAVSTLHVAGHRSTRGREGARRQQRAAPEMVQCMLRGERDDDHDDDHDSDKDDDS